VTTAQQTDPERDGVTAVGALLDRRVRHHCCGAELAEHGPGGNWGDWKCRRCGTAYCQDCGAQINMWTMQCTAYEESQDAKDDVA